MFDSMEDLIEANKSAGNYWFSPSTMAWFGSRIESGLIGGRYFVTSEQGPDEPRRYSVREAQSDATIETVGEFYAYRTVEEALAVAAEYLARG